MIGASTTFIETRPTAPRPAGTILADAAPSVMGVLLRINGGAIHTTVVIVFTKTAFTKTYMGEVVVVDPKFVELAPRFFKIADSTKISKRKRQERIKPLYDMYHEPNSWRLSKRRA